ncbi:hypothetical protein J6397_23165 [Rhodococcus qingshengii]|uniref:hypothetical protein n=1 Tax=Rhodococcus qingshengii TaxID=334542 RepID=UPI001AEA6CBF|nr:hypothetical protein [Rhodococcus qingshengii]MBP1053061.1 hypothetical protein [Rhodococcus qingshengii]
MAEDEHTAKKIEVRAMDHSFELIPGLKIRRQANVKLFGYRGYDVDADLVVTDSGKAEVSRMAVIQREGGEPVTGVALRSIAVQSVVKAYVRMEVTTWMPYAAGTRVVAFGILEEEEAQKLRSLGPVPETLEAVAKVYRVAEFLEDPPVKAVEAAFSIPRGTAGSWIGRARAAGLIQSVKGGTNGEA